MESPVEDPGAFTNKSFKNNNFKTSNQFPSNNSLYQWKIIIETMA